MKEIDQKAADRCAKKIRAELEKLLQMARDAGIANPEIYIESEHGVHLLDRDHPSYAGDGSKNREAIVFSVHGALPIATDVGAW